MARAHKIMGVVGARPNMMKMAPILREMARYPDIQSQLVHTGQHYDTRMSDIFFEQLGMRAPDFNLEVGSGSHHAQTGEVIKRFGELVSEQRPDMIVVVGDVNSTIACALVAAKEGIPIAHVESGLRSFDRAMPEEVNRVLTDAISDLLFTTEASGNENLLREGIAPEKIFFTGNVMIDSLVRMLPAARESQLLRQLGLGERAYVVLTLHRPSNVDNPEKLNIVLEALSEISQIKPIIFPVHPRTSAKIADLAIGRSLRAWDGSTPILGPGIWTIPPSSYLDFIGLVDRAAAVITDSGGTQEETTYLGVPCLTFRENTERPITITHGTNQLIGTDPERLKAAARKALSNGFVKSEEPRRPELWDGHAAERIVAYIREFLRSRNA